MPSNLMTNPLATMMRGASPSGPTGPAPASPGAAPGAGGGLAQMLGGLFAKQQMADPQFLTKQLNQIRTSIAEMIPKTIGRMDGIATELAPMLRHLDRAIEKAAQQAKADSVVRSPLGFSGAQANPGQDQGGGGPQF